MRDQSFNLRELRDQLIADMFGPDEERRVMMTIFAAMRTAGEHWTSDGAAYQEAIIQAIIALIINSPAEVDLAATLASARDRLASRLANMQGRAP